MRGWVGSDFEARGAVFLPWTIKNQALRKESTVGDLRGVWVQSPKGLCCAYLDLIS